MILNLAQLGTTRFTQVHQKVDVHLVPMLRGVNEICFEGQDHEGLCLFTIKVFSHLFSVGKVISNQNLFLYLFS